MKKVIRLTESDLMRLVKRVIKEQESLLNEDWKDVLLGISLLTGVGLNQSQAQTAKNVLSNDEVRNKIESTLQDTSTLNLITKNLSPEIQEKIRQNADNALEDLKGKYGRVTSTIKAKDDKQLSTRLKQGYALTDIDTKSDTIHGKDTAIVYTESLDFTIKSDGLFITGGSRLSPEGVNIIESIKDSIEDVGGEIEFVNIDAGTDTEPIRMGNKRLAELRAESVAIYFNDVDDVNINTDGADKGPDFNSLVKELGREKAREETAKYRYVKITVKATFKDTLTNTDVLPEEVIEKNTYTLVKIINKKSSGGPHIKTKRTKGFRPTIKKSKCGKTNKCPVHGRKKIQNFLNFNRR
jgi:flagellar motor protein MotB